MPTLTATSSITAADNVAILILKACTETLQDRIHKEIEPNIRLLNDGSLVWLTLYKLIFPHTGTYQEVLRNMLKNLTLASCDGKFKDFCDKFKKIFKPVHKHLASPKLHDQWKAFVTQCLTH